MSRNGQVDRSAVVPRDATESGDDVAGKVLRLVPPPVALLGDVVGEYDVVADNMPATVGVHHDDQRQGVVGGEHAVAALRAIHERGLHFSFLRFFADLVGWVW